MGDKSIPITSIITPSGEKLEALYSGPRLKSEKREFIEGVTDGHMAALETVTVRDTFVFRGKKVTSERTYLQSACKEIRRSKEETNA